MDSSYWDRYAFSVGEVDFQWIDIAMAAMARGRWSAFERRLAEGLACTARADAEDAWPPQDAVDEAATAFRYDHDLISGADVTAWLERAGLSADEWTAYVTRDLLRRTWQDDLEGILDQFAPSARELVSAAVPEGICSSMFEAFDRDLCGLAAFAFDADPALLPRPDGGGEALRPLEDVAARLAHTHAHWLVMRPPSETASRFLRILSLNSACEMLGDRVASNGRVSAVLEANRLAWMRLEVDTISFGTEAAAHEAVLCIKEDGLTLHDVAGLSHCMVSRVSMFLEEAGPPYRDHLLAAEPGHVLGPIAAGDRFQVTTLVDRVAPALADRRVAERARQAVIDAAVAHAVRDHVTRRASP